jgi:hypothetical protein
MNNENFGTKKQSKKGLIGVRLKNLTLFFCYFVKYYVPL